MKKLILIALFIQSFLSAQTVIWQEAESLENTGGWANDPQHIDIMGSPYLLSVGLGETVEDASGKISVPQSDEYTLWVRCRDWFPSHSPGQFQVSINGQASNVIFGKAKNDQWQWFNGGKFNLKSGTADLIIHDKTGWWGRVDAIVLSTGNFKPANDLKRLNQQRIKYNGVSTEVKEMGHYDLVVVGGGSAGMGAALGAARNGAKVAFIQDRPMLGGNASSEIQVPPMGTQTEHPVDRANVTGLAEELYPIQGRGVFGDSSHYLKLVEAEANIDLFLNTRAIDVTMKDKKTISSVIAIDVKTGQRMSFQAPLFADTTGHGWIGYYTGAEYRHGTESRHEFGESMAPVKANKFTMGNSLYKIQFQKQKSPVTFSTPAWAYQWTKPSDFDSKFSIYAKDTKRAKAYDKAVKGRGNKVNRLGGAYTWFLELGGTEDTVNDAEKIRDHLFRVHIGIWGYQKNYSQVEKTKNLKMTWMNYVPGVRESRRLMGDYIMTQKDFEERTIHHDSIAFTDWGLDDHHPHGFFTKGTFVLHPYKGRRVNIPYRSLYSRNIDNLFMAGRCMSVSHVALTGVRVERPLTATGQAVGIAAAIASREKTTPRGVLKSHLDELQQTLLKNGCFIPKLKNQDPKDLALSSFTKNREIIDGWNREIKGVSKAAPWSAKPIELKLAKTSSISTIHLSLQDRFKSVNFEIEAKVNGEWIKISNSSGSVKKRRFVIQFKPLETKHLRFKLLKSSGPVGICEVRVYK
ncbi:MAG: FAD-dependent oxidoreductase [Lentisphaeraceae bacterium]|nr:FAD-dependent oxidoreductase [Lentisphaeraceae bacterium]